MTDAGKDERLPTPEPLVKKGETIMDWFVSDFITDALPGNQYSDPEAMASEMIVALPVWITKTTKRLESTEGPLAREHLELARSFSFGNVVDGSDKLVKELREQEELESDPEMKKRITTDIEAWWNIGIAATIAKNRAKPNPPSTTLK